jgi:hypothetical protein
LGIAVDAEQREFRMSVKERGGVPAEADRRVERHGRSTRQRWLEQLEAPEQQNGSMLR